MDPINELASLPGASPQFSSVFRTALARTSDRIRTSMKRATLSPDPGPINLKYVYGSAASPSIVESTYREDVKAE